MSHQGKNKISARTIAASLVVAGTLAGASQGMAMDGKKEISNINSSLSQFDINSIQFEPIKLNDLNWYSEVDIPKEIPLLDLKNMSKNEKLDCIKKASELSHCFYVKNHNIEMQDIEGLINTTRDFFNAPNSIKTKVKHPCHGMLRGYSGYQEQSSEKSVGVPNEGKGDSHISFSWGSFDNVYPDLNFKETWKSYFDKSYDLAKTLSELIIESLEIGDELTWGNIKGGDNILKIQEFIEGNQEFSQPYRIVPHADSSFITLLTQIPADNGYMGLEAKIGGEFIGVPAVKDTILVNFGEPAYSLTKGRLKPVIHQVVSPKENYKGSSRLSIPFFFQPNPETKIYPYEDSTYKKYYNSDGETLFSEFSKNLLSDFLK